MLQALRSAALATAALATLAFALPGAPPAFAQNGASPSSADATGSSTGGESDRTSASGGANDSENASSGAPTGSAADLKTDNVTSFTLDNGLQVIVLPDDRAPVVTQMVYYKVGAADEVPGVSGIAHFLEHLMFKGTSNHPEGEFSTKVAEIGGRENAFTSNDYTGYYQQVPSDALEMVMRFEADRMSNLTLTDEQVNTERDVILEERRMRIDNSPSAQLNEAVQAALYQNSPYGTPVIGWRSEMEDLTREEALDFYNRYYTPNNAVLLIAGDVTVDKARRLAEEIYGSVQKRAETPTRNRPSEPESLASRTVTLTDGRVTQPSMQRSYVVPSDTTAEGDEALSLDLLADILGGGTTSRLYRDLVVDKGIAAGVGAYYRGTALKEGEFTLYGTPRGEASVDDVEKAILDQLRDVRENGVSSEELEKAKNRVRNNLIYLRDDQTSMARRYAAALTTGEDLQQVESWPERIQKVTVDEVNAVAKKYLEPQRSVTGYLLPEGETTASASNTDGEAGSEMSPGGPAGTAPPLSDEAS